MASSTVRNARGCTRTKSKPNGFGDLQFVTTLFVIL